MIIDTPGDFVFGIDRKGRRLLELRNGDDIRRDFATPISATNDGDIYIGLLAHLVGPQGKADMLEISLEPNLPGRGRSRYRIASSGVTSDGFPIINSGGNVVQTATVLTDEPYFFVFNLQVSNGSMPPRSVRASVTHLGGVSDFVQNASVVSTESSCVCSGGKRESSN